MIYIMYTLIKSFSDDPSSGWGRSQSGRSHAQPNRNVSLSERSVERCDVTELHFFSVNLSCICIVIEIFDSMLHGNIGGGLTCL